MKEVQWILYPVCGNKTRLKIGDDTELKNFPLEGAIIMSLKGKIPPELKIQAVEDYLSIRKGSTQIREELGIRLNTFQT